MADSIVEEAMATGSEAASSGSAASTRCLRPEDASPEITPFDEALYRRIVRVDLGKAIEERIRTPAKVYPQQREVLAVHWHSEHIPLEWIEDRIARTFPAREVDLLIPTNHNVITTFGDYAGVEIDCYSQPFQRKVQLLCHFERSRVEGDRADVLRSMLLYTFRYRASQLFEFFHTLNADTDVTEARRQEAAEHTAATDDVVRFVRMQTIKLEALLARFEAETPREAVRNKLIKWYFDGLRDRYDRNFIGRCQAYVQAVKEVVKQHFSPEYFYETEAVIEEVRGLGGCIVIPHPEQFWPILLADYDVDGYEVWNPQSRDFTEFLINVVRRQNKVRAATGKAPLLITMGDDCHMGEKAKEPGLQDEVKASREIGVQPDWDDLLIQKSLMICNMGRRRVIAEYKARLAG